jgi:F-box protein 11
MTDNNAFDRFVADYLADDGSGAVQAERITARTHQRTGEMRQLPRWLALIKEPPMRIDQHPAVGSPTVRVVAIVAATLFLALVIAGAGAGAQLLLAADDRVITVAQDGTGDYESIAEAVASARSGDEIVISPGTYNEAVVIDKDVTVRGDGEPGAVVVTAPADGPVRATGWWANPEAEYAVALVGSGGRLSDLVFEGVASRVIVDGGAPTVQRLTFDEVGEAPENAGSPALQAVLITGGSTATVRESTFRGSGGVNIVAAAAPTLERNTFVGMPAILGEFGDGTIIADNAMPGPGGAGISSGPAAVTVRGNTVEDRLLGIGLSGASLVEDNVVRGSDARGIGVTFDASGSPTVRGNRLEDNATAITWEGGGLIEGNEVSGGLAGILITFGSPEVRGNVIDGVRGRALFAGPGTAPTLSGNSSCGNGQNLVIDDGSTPADDGTNEICEDVALQ